MALGQTHLKLLNSADANGKIKMHNRKFQTRNALDTLVNNGLAIYETRQYKGEEWIGFWITDAGRKCIEDCAE